MVRVLENLWWWKTEYKAFYFDSASEWWHAMRTRPREITEMRNTRVPYNYYNYHHSYNYHVYYNFYYYFY